MSDAADITLPISGRIDANNAQETEAAIRAAMPSGAERLTLDAAGLDYISSAGLRVLLRLRKNVRELAVINVSSSVYEVLDTTGFTEMLTVQKACRSLSVEGCEQIGSGANGAVYRIDGETVVKVYNDPDSLDEIMRERENAKLALVLGLPTAISYDVVRVGGGYGSVFELLNARSLSKILAAEPEKFDLCVREFADLLKQIHSTEAPEGRLPDMKTTVLSWAKDLRGYLPDEYERRLTALIEAVPEGRRLLHGDYHTKNIMMQDGEALLIDMDTLSTGDPVFELGTVYCAFVGFYESDRDSILRFQGFDHDTGVRFFESALSAYLGTECEPKLKEVRDKARIVAYVRMMSRSIRHGLLNDPLRREEFEHWRGRLIALLDSVDELTFRVNELTVPAQRALLDEVMKFIGERTAPLSPSEKALNRLSVAAEEVFVNIADYAYPDGKGSIYVSVDTDPGSKEAAVTFRDSGRPFDPLGRPDPDVSLPLSERTPGGLGVFLLKKLADDVSYSYRDGENVLTIRKKL